MRPSLAQKKGFVTADLWYAHVWKFRPRVWPFRGEFCVTHARRSVCPRLDPWPAYACDADRRHAPRGAEGCCRCRSDSLGIGCGSRSAGWARATSRVAYDGTAGDNACSCLL